MGQNSDQNQTEPLKNNLAYSDQEANIQYRIGIMEGELVSLKSQYAFAEKHISALAAGDTRLFKLVLAFIGISTAIIAITGVITYKINTDQVNDTVSDARTKIDEIANKIFIDRSEVRGSLKRDVVYADPNFDLDVRHNVLATFILNFDFNFLIDVYGKGTGKLLGVFVKLDGDISNDLSADIHGKPDNYLSLTRKNGTVIYLNSPSIAIEGFSIYYVQTFTTHRSTCEEVTGVINKYSNGKKAGRISITPVFEMIKDKPQERWFDVEITKPNVIFTCAALNSLLVSQKKQQRTTTD